MNAETNKGVVSPFTIYSIMIGYPTQETECDLTTIQDFLRSNGATVGVLDAFNRIGEKIKRGVLDE